MQDYVSELGIAEASREALVEDAVVWASQHGLVSSCPTVLQNACLGAIA